MVYVGIYGGLIFGLLGWYFGRRAARKNRGLDEMHDYIWNKARSASWYAVITAIYLLMTLHVSGITINLMPALSILLFVQLSSWAITGAVYASKLTTNSTVNQSFVLSTIIAAFFIVFFIIVSLLTDNWKFLLAAIPPIVMNIVITATQMHRAKNAEPKT
ncbi:hypothetical protein ACFP56_14530 [Paenibacillus septentrionalis]|uniref:Uncharacterized protein n=1 Tax=Paenibacillus septentrionalis TaxID=429342 RepID=A0ABW1V5E6_9BACL